MSLKKVTAIFDELKLDAVEIALAWHGIRGFTVHKVKGRGEYFNSFSRDPLTPHVLLEIYTSESCAPKVARLIVEVVHADMEDEGLVSIETVDKMYWIHSKLCCEESDFDFKDTGHG